MESVLSNADVVVGREGTPAYGGGLGKNMTEKAREARPKRRQQAAAATRADQRPRTPVEKHTTGDASLVGLSALQTLRLESHLMQTAQRQALVAQLGRLHGNRWLNRWHVTAGTLSSPLNPQMPQKKNRRKRWAQRQPKEEQPWLESDETETKAAKGVQAKAETGGADSIDEPVTEARIKLPGEGRPLPEGLRSEAEVGLGADFSTVRVHDSAEDLATAKSSNAKAFTYRDHIWTDSGASAVDRKLMAHEPVHAMQQLGSNRIVGQRIGPCIQRSEETDLIDEHTSWGNLNEARLGRGLLIRAQRNQYAFVGRVLNELGSTDRDDVAYEMMRQTTDDALNTFVGADAGRRMLDRLYDELTSGSVADEEQAQATRILTAKARTISTEQFATGVERAKIFPFRLPGLTVINDAPINAERRAGGRIWVRQPVRVLGTRQFRSETRTLPSKAFIGGIELPENEIIGVKMYDLGGEIHYRPALYLVQLSNETITTIYQAMGEAAALGLTLGSGALVGAGARAGWGARVLLWADRAATVLGTLTTIIREHRGWIISRFGESGRTFLRYVDMVQSAVMIYGGARALIGVGQLINGLRRSYRNWRSAAGQVESELSSSERAAVRGVSDQTDDFLENVDHLRRGDQPPGIAAAEEAAESVPSTRSAAQRPRGGGSTGIEEPHLAPRREAIYQTAIQIGGQRHLLKIERFAGRFRVVMCTQCGPLIFRLEAALQQQGPQMTRNLRGRLTRLRDRTREVERQLNSGRITQQEAQRRANQIAANLRDTARRHRGLEEIAPFREWRSVRGFEREISRLRPGERVAVANQMAQSRARIHGWRRDNRVSRLNNRTVYRDPNSRDYYSVDTQHGRFEHCNRHGVHQGEVDMDLYPTAPADPAGGHDLDV